MLYCYNTYVPGRRTIWYDIIISGLLMLHNTCTAYRAWIVQICRFCKRRIRSVVEHFHFLFALISWWILQRSKMQRQNHNGHNGHCYWMARLLGLRLSHASIFEFMCVGFCVHLWLDATCLRRLCAAVAAASGASCGIAGAASAGNPPLVVVGSDLETCK